MKGNEDHSSPQKGRQSRHQKLPTDKSTLTSVQNLHKIFSNRLKKELDEHQPQGFREGFSTMDHLLAINQLIEKSIEYQLDLCIGFIDYEKPFDSIEHPDLFQAFRKIEV